MSAIEIRDEINISKNPITIWRILADINSWRLWSGVIDRAVIYGQPRPGTAFKCLADNWDFDCLIEDAAPGKTFAGKAKTIGLRVAFQWQFSEIPDGTRVEFSTALEGWMSRLFGNRFRRGFERAIFTWLLALKNYAERGIAKTTDEKKAGSSGRLRKRRLSFDRPLFGMFQPGRRDRDDED